MDETERIVWKNESRFSAECIDKREFAGFDAIKSLLLPTSVRLYGTIWLVILSLMLSMPIQVI